MVTVMHIAFVYLLVAISSQRVLSFNNKSDVVIEETTTAAALTTTMTDVPEQATESNVYYIKEERSRNISIISTNLTNVNAVVNANMTTPPHVEARIKLKNQKRKNSAISEAIKLASIQGFNAMIDLYDRKEPEILRKGEFLDFNHPAVKLSLFSAPMTNETDTEVRGAFASLYAAKKLQQSLNLDLTGLGRQTAKKRISLQKTRLESFCPPRESPQCLPATKRYRTHDGTCNNFRKPRWGSAQMPFHRFLPPNYSDGIETVRGSALGGSLPSARFVSLVVHGYREDEAPITMLLPQWGQLIDHDLTATLQPRSINGSIPRCCQSTESHPSCLPITVPRDDPFLGSLGVKCLEFLRSSPAQRRDCLLSWREQTNQVTSFIDASPVYSSNPRTADSSRIFRDGLLLFGRGPPREDSCLKGGFNHHCIRAGDTRAGEQPGLLAMHTTFVAEHNRIAIELADLNPHWSDEKLYQETRRIIGAIFQHITFREFLPLVLGKEVCRLFDLDLESSGYYHGYDPKVNPFIANSFSAAAFRFGHSLVQGSIMRSDSTYRFLSNNVSLHEENSIGDIGSVGSIHRIIRGLASQRTLRRDEFISPELTNHLFQSGSFPFGMDLAAINIQRGRDHGIPAYVEWRKPCGLSEIRTWEDLDSIVGPKSANRIRRAYDRVEDIDLFVGGIAERPVIGGLVGPTFACIIAQQFNNLRRGDRFWYENPNFESSFTPAQIFSIRQVSLSQILCRQLGNSNTMQPFAFLPAEFAGNERQRCGIGQLAPINLNPWLERDPFHKESDLPAINNLIFSNNNNNNNINNRPNEILTSGNVDLDVVRVTPRPSPSPSTIVDNKVDFTATTTKPTTSTTKKKKKIKTTTTTRKPSVTIIDNKIDFKHRSTAKSTINNTATTVRENVAVKKDNISASHRDNNGPERRSDEDTEIESVKSKTFFVNEDNATKYHNNRPVAPRLDTQHDNDDYASPEARIQIILPQQTNNKRFGPDYDIDNRPLYDYNFNRPNSYSPIYTPIMTQSTSTRRPILFQNNKPSYDDFNNNNSRYPTKRPTSSPISSQVSSTPFSYDLNPEAFSSSVGYEHMSVPLYVTSNRLTPRPTYQELYTRPSNYYTTRRSDGLSTFMYIGTTKKSPIYPIFQTPISILRRTSSPDYKLSLSTPSPSSSSVFYSDDLTNPLSAFISSSAFSNTNKFSSIKRPSVFSSDKIDMTEFDKETTGLEMNIYIPNRKSQKPAYIDYSNYNSRPETSTKSDIKFVYLENVLHKYQAGKNSEVEEGLFDRSSSSMNRYAEKQVDLRNNKERLDVTTVTTSTVKNEETKKVEGRSERRNRDREEILIVPFKLLTRVDRPDNWLNTETDDNHYNNSDHLKNQLPQIPDLQQNGNIAKELPKPLLGKKKTIHKTHVNVNEKT